WACVEKSRASPLRVADDTRPMQSTNVLAPGSIQVNEMVDVAAQTSPSYSSRRSTAMSYRSTLISAARSAASSRVRLAMSLMSAPVARPREADASALSRGAACSVGPVTTHLGDEPESWTVLGSRDLYRDDWLVALRADRVRRPGAEGEEPFERWVV